MGRRRGHTTSLQGARHLGNKRALRPRHTPASCNVRCNVRWSLKFCFLHTDEHFLLGLLPMSSAIHNHYVAGRWLSSEESIENRSPSDTSDLVGVYAQATPRQLDEALDAASDAQKIWGNTKIEERSDILNAIGIELKTRAKELGELLSREEGKPLAEGTGEVYRAGQFFTYYAAEVLRQLGETADSVRPGIEIDIRREPLGVVGIVSPWNFPIATASWKIAPALAFGNSVVWKPANLTPASACSLAEIIDRHNLPDGAFNLVMGKGSTLGEHLAASSKAQGISFTGSVETGRKIAQKAVSAMTKLQMEMGAKNALVVADDADCDLAVACAVQGAFGGTGQKCTASSRLIVMEKIYDAFVEKMIAATNALRVGHALEKDTQIGPVVSQTQLESNLGYLKLAEEEGCSRACGGEVVARKTEGYYLTPALLLEGSNDMRINREEMFAPVACVIKVASYEEALSTANDSPFGLVAGIVTASLARATHFRRNVRCGCVMVNLPTAGTDYHVPFGGRGISSYGSREQGRYAEEFYTQVKTSYTKAGAPEE